jgi:hypothetical protein
MSDNELPTRVDTARKTLIQDLHDMKTMIIPIKSLDGTTHLLSARLSAVSAMETMIDVAVDAWPKSDMVLTHAAAIVHFTLFEFMQELQAGGHIALFCSVYWRTICIAHSGQEFVRVFGSASEQSPLGMLQTIFAGYSYSPLQLRELFQRLRAYTGAAPALDALIDALAESVLPAHDVIAAACDAAVEASKPCARGVQNVVYDLACFARRLSETRA